LKLRLEADNPGMILRPDMFVDVEFRAAAPAGISIPNEAVLDSGMQKIVYVETSNDVFEPRAVELGATFGDRVSVKRGLAEGDRVVTSGNFLIDSESRMKPGSLQSVNDKHEGPAVSPKAEVVKVKAGEAIAMVKDPVCGMAIDASKAAASGHTESYRGEMLAFCSDKCRDKFRADPAKYLDDRLRSDAKSGSRRHDD
jgi:YHS domain-containing protein